MNEEDAITPGTDSSAMEKLIVEQEAPKDEIDTPEPPKEPAKSSDGNDKSVDVESKSEDDHKELKELEPPKEPAEAPKEEPKEETPPEDKFDEEVDAIKPKHNASPGTVKAVAALREKAKAEHKAAREWRTKFEARDKEFTEAKTLSPEVEQELGELRAFRQSVDIESDPAFNEQFGTRITQYEEGAINLLKSWKLPDSAADYIKNNGGVLRFRTSQELMPKSKETQNEDGSTMTREQWWERKVMANMTAVQKEDMGDLLGELRQLHRGKEAAIQNAQQNRQQFLSQRAAQFQQAAGQFAQRIEEHAKKILPQYGEIAQEKEIPASATPEVKAQIEKHNANFKKAQQIAQKYVSQVTPESLTEAAIGAAYATIARDILKEKSDDLEKSNTRIKELEQQILDIKSAGKTSHRKSEPTTNVTKTPANVNAETAMTKLLEETE